MTVLSWALLAVLSLGVHASVLTLHSPRFTITGPDAAQLRTEPYASPRRILRSY